MTAFKILVDLIHKLTLFVNGLGQPKVKQGIVEHETITAIKVKEKQPEAYQESPWVRNENKEPKSNVTGYTTTVGHHGTSSVYGNASTSAYRNNKIKLGGKYFDPNTFQEIFPEDLKDLLNGGDNILPTDIWKMYMNKKSTPQMRRVLNKLNK
jgi:hypothetical protein